MVSTILSFGLIRNSCSDKEFIVVPAHPSYTKQYHDVINQLLLEQFGYHTISYPDEHDEETKSTNNKTPQSLILLEKKKKAQQPPKRDSTARQTKWQRWSSAFFPASDVDSSPVVDVGTGATNNDSATTTNNNSNNDTTINYVPIGHVEIERAKNYQMATLSKQQIEKLLQRGVPEASVRIMVTMKGGDDYDTIMNSTTENNNAENQAEEFIVSIGALVIHPQYRGYGLGKALAHIAVLYSVNILHASQVRAYAATEELVHWYQRMGAQLDRTNSNIITKSSQQQSSTAVRSFSIDTSLIQNHTFQENEQLHIPNNITVITMDELY